MTLIEFFDDEIIDNVIGTLLLRPERTVILYPKGKDTDFITVLKKILSARNIKTEVLCEEVDVSCVESAGAKIEEIVTRFPNCDFDIAGGNEVMLVAMGSAAKKHSLPMHAVDVRKRQVTALSGTEGYTITDTFLSSEELIGLYGGKTSCDLRVKETYEWKRNGKSEEDIEKVWSICRQNPGAWNMAVGAIRHHQADKKDLLSMLWSKLKRAGLVYSDQGTVKHKNELVKYLLGRQGTALEMFTYIAAKEAGCFDDGQSGALIDWKGRREVENEIDVLLMRGVVGYFISCKNGMVDSSELYKLSTVANRFGGRYAKKALVVSAFEPDKSFMERAAELGITVIKNARHLNKKDLAKRLADI